MIDLLPKSTVSHVLRQPGKLPRWEFVKAFVAACLRNADHPADQIPAELEHWRAARAALAEPPSPPEPSADVVEAAPPQTIAEGRRASHQTYELLARRVAREEDRARKGLLGGYSIAPISFGITADLTPRADDVDDLHTISRFFSGLRPQRLMVVGESGSGKTVLAIELVLQLVEPLLEADGRFGDSDDGRCPMVPVRLNAARWTVGSTIESWLTTQLVQDFGLAEKDSARLVRERRVLPVVDGLDELDAEPITGQPRRAIGLLAALNRYSDLSGRRPGAVVVTCRTDRYAELSRARAELDNAARVHLHALSIEQIRAYLQDRWPHGHLCSEQREEIHKALSGPSGTAVHLTLSTPWRLLLTVTAVESGTAPAELLHAEPDADPLEASEQIAGRLLGAYIPAATELTPRVSQAAPYEPDHVRSWLTHLAVHLRWQAVQAAGAHRPPPGMTAIDIVPHLVWPIGGERLVRALHGLCSVSVAIVAMVAFWIGSAVDRPENLRDGLTAGEGLTLALMVGWTIIAIGLSLSRWVAATGGHCNVPWRQRATGGVLGASVGAMGGMLCGWAGFLLTTGNIFGPLFATLAGAAGGLVLGGVIGLAAAGRQGTERMTVAEAVRTAPFTQLGFGLCGALTGLPPLRLADASPPALAAGVAGSFVLAFALGVAFTMTAGGWRKDAELTHPREALRRNPINGVAFGLIGGVAAFLVFVLNQGIVASLACALVGGVSFGLAFGATAWSRTMIGLLVTAARGLLPLRLFEFLDWACEAHLLRISGATYQFRHRELQDFLAPPSNTYNSHVHHQRSTAR